MIYLEDIMDVDLLQSMVAQGYVRVREHPDLPLDILNYTPAAQYEKVWNDVTRQTRGLIVNRETGEIVARPFRKFFNYGERDDLVTASGPVRVYDKVDGSLGIVYPTPDGPAVATRGSFTSDQALHATDWLRRNMPDFWPMDGMTYLAEIIYPENRIVVDYGNQDVLVLLAVLHTETGQTMPEHDDYGWRYPGLHAHKFPFRSLEEVLAAPQFEGSNMEGFVVHFLDTDQRVKVKFEEYVRLHRIITGFSSKTVWEILSTGGDFEAILDRVPDEFYAWIKCQAQDLREAYAAVEDAAQLQFRQAMNQVGWENFGREAKKQFAEIVKESEYRAILFRMFDDKPHADIIWKMIKPSASRPFYQQSEDVA